MRKEEFQTGEYYHILNRGVDKREIFSNSKDYLRFIRSMREFNRLEAIGSLYEKAYSEKLRKRFNLRGEGKEAKLPIGSLASSVALFDRLPRIVEIICYCLMPNHFHFIMKQLDDKGIERYMHKVGTGYTNYFNQKYSRSGSLFQGTYKSIPITTNEYLIWLSAYIHGNPEIHKLAKAENWSWSSYQDYLSERNGTLCYKDVIMNQFNNIQEYQEMVNMIIKDSGERKEEI